MDAYFRKHQTWILPCAMALGIFLFFLGHEYTLIVVAWFWLGVLAEHLWGWNKCYEALKKELQEAEQRGDTKRAAQALELLVRLGLP